MIRREAYKWQPKRKRDPRPVAEEAIQCAVVEHLRFRARPNVVWHSIPNESKRPPAQAEKLKRMGLVVGAADFLVIVDGRPHYIEFKRPDGQQTPEQKAFQLWCEIAGVPYAIARSVDDALHLLERWGALKQQRRAA